MNPVKGFQQNFTSIIIHLFNSMSLSVLLSLFSESMYTHFYIGSSKQNPRKVFIEKKGVSTNYVNEF